MYGKFLVMLHQQLPLARLTDHPQSFVHLIDSAHTLERLVGSDATELIEILHQLCLLQQILPKNADHCVVIDKRRQDDIGKKTLGAVAAPFILLAASIAALEHRKILRMTGEHLGNLQLGIGTQITIVMVAVVEESANIPAEVLLVLQRLGILMVNLRSGNGRLIGARLIGEGHVTGSGAVAHQQSVETEHGRKRRMAIQETLFVELQQLRIDFALQHHPILFGREACYAGTVHRGTTRIDDERYDLAFFVGVKTTVAI